jgi:hypothetical protein
MIDTEFIKVITGVRRSGKSYLLLMIKNMLLERGVKEQCIIYINFENPDNAHLILEKNLYDFVKLNKPDSGKVYLLFDEIQEVNEWQKQVNGMRVAFDCDIYLTGSNASLLSGELATYLTGRFVEIKMLPLSFSEYLMFKNLENGDSSRYFQDYVQYGGFPSVVLQDDAQLKKDVLNGIYQSILWRDVAFRSDIREPDTLERIARFLIDNIGHSVTTNKIANTIRSSGKKISNVTVDAYLKLLEDSFLFYKAQRYDIRGKEYLKSQAKYYVSDLGIVLSALKKTQSNRGSKIENIVFLELKRKGYEVFVGKYDSKEIDFVALRMDQTLYIQVTDQLPDESDRETDNLLYLPTGHKKMVITNHWENVGTIDGIEIVHVVDFLLGND